MFVLLVLLVNSIHFHVFALERKSPSLVAVTPHVLTLETSPFRYPLTAASDYLTKRFDSLPILNPTTAQDEDPRVASIQEDLLTIGGRVYMTNITLSGRPYTVVIDTGSSDTWVASSNFSCVSNSDSLPLPQEACGFGELYDVDDSATFSRIPDFGFGVSYTDGEFLSGHLGYEMVGIGGLEVDQVIGVVQEGWWMGDGISSGLLGLAYSGLVSQAGVLGYEAVAASLFKGHPISPIFSLALSRPTWSNPRAGGLLAFGGIPDVPTDGDFVTVPILPMVKDTYAFYTVPADGFTVEPPISKSRHRSMRARPNVVTNAKFLSTPLEMVIDSGSTLIYLPDLVADYIAALFEPPAIYIPQSGLYTVPCQALAPRVGVKIAGRTFWIDSRDLLPGSDAERVTGQGGGFRRGGDGDMCVLAVQRMGLGDAVLGDAFLKGVVAVFDLGGDEMRFAARHEY